MQFPGRASIVSAQGARSLHKTQIWHGFVRARDGTIASIDPKGSTQTQGTGANANGQVVGYFETAGTYRAFLRDADGNVTDFAVNGSSGTFPTAINGKGVIAGSFWDQNSGTPGFLRTIGGKLRSFEPPGAEDTEVFRINP